MTTKKCFRNFQLRMMGWIAILIAPVTLFFASVIHDKPFLASISESGTIANRVSPLLPFALGAFALFALSYARYYAYDALDRLTTMAMTVGFTLVAVQMCASPYVTESGVGIFNLTPELSHTVHVAGAFLGFGAMIIWIGICFRRSNKPPEKRTAEKQQRNIIYAIMGTCMVFSLMLFIPYQWGRLGADFPIVWVVEAIMLVFGGVACLIKGGLFLKDKNKTVPCGRKEGAS